MNYENASFVKNLWLTFDKNTKTQYKIWTDHVEFRVPFKHNLQFNFYSYENYIRVSILRNQSIVAESRCYSHEYVVLFLSGYLNDEDQQLIKRAFELVENEALTEKEPPKDDNSGHLSISEKADTSEHEKTLFNKAEKVGVQRKTIDNNSRKKDRKRRWNRKKLLLVASLMLFISALGFGIYYSSYGPIKIIQVKKELECGDSYAIEDLAKSNKNVSLSIVGYDGDVVIDKIGETTLEVVGERGNQKHKQRLTYNVIDTKPPKLEFSNTPTVKCGLDDSAVIDNLKDLKVADTADGDVDSSKIRIEGNYNLNVGGEYDVRLVVSDESGNETAKKTTITVDDGSIPWNKAMDYVGQYVTIRGPLISVVPKSYVYGSPTFINIGNNYPNPERFQAVIWGENLNGELYKKAEDLYDNYAYEEEIYIIEIKGTVVNYDGVPEIIVDSADQLIYPTGW